MSFRLITAQSAHGLMLNTAPARLFRLLLILSVAFSLTGCLTQLSPDYDGELLQGVIDSNKTAQVLFAKVEFGSPEDKFPQFENEYAEAIASFEALRLRADARPFPPLSRRIMKLKFLSGVCAPQEDPDSCLDSTTGALKIATDRLRDLRTEHHDNGLSKAEVQGVKGQFDQAIDQALTVETALQR